MVKEKVENARRQIFDVKKFNLLFSLNLFKISSIFHIFASNLIIIIDLSYCINIIGEISLCSFKSMNLVA